VGLIGSTCTALPSAPHRTPPATPGTPARTPVPTARHNILNTSQDGIMTKCVKPLRHLATSSTKSSKWSVLIGRAGRLSTKSH
jgi:hypothetical protein